MTSRRTAPGQSQIPMCTSQRRHLWWFLRLLHHGCLFLPRLAPSPALIGASRSLRASTANATRADPQAFRTAVRGRTETASTPPADGKDVGDQMRAADLLEEAIKAPKTGALAPVLSTLQPEQYRLVTWPSDKNLVVQGHPGTGKTIVAAHRAAFLVLPRDREDESPQLHRVALVGPTDRWKEHIAPTVQYLVDEGVEVLSLENTDPRLESRPSACAPPPDREGASLAMGDRSHRGRCRARSTASAPSFQNLPNAFGNW